MSDLTSRERELVAIGAALGSNCVPCIEYHIPEARKAGLSETQIAEAVRLADKVRKVPAGKVLGAAERLLATGAVSDRAVAEAVGCGQAEAASNGDGPCCS